MKSPSGTSAPASYPTGGRSVQNGGEGIYVDSTGEEPQPLEVWVDTDLKDRLKMIKLLRNEGAVIASYHWSPTTRLIILSSRSVGLFNMYCHPDWLRPNARSNYTRSVDLLAAKGQVFEDPWKQKVLLKEWWVDRCAEAGRFLGEEDNWGGCRAGGPPTDAPKYTPPIPRPSPLLTPASSHHRSLSPDTVEEGTAEPREEPVAEPMQAQSEPAPVSGDSGADAEGQAADQSMDMDIDEPSSPQRPNAQTDDVVMAPADERRALNDNDPPANTKTAIEETDQAGEALHPRPNDPPPSQTDDGRMDEEDHSQSAADPPATQSAPEKIFDGLRFWVDQKKPDRTLLLRQLIKAGGKIVADYAEATHVLIHGYVTLNVAEKRMWHGITAQFAKQGTWFVNVQWAVKSLEDNLRHDEEEYHVPHGAPFSASRDEKPQVSQRPPDSLDKRLQTARLVEIFRDEADVLRPMTRGAAGRYLAEKYTVHKPYLWAAHLSQYENRKGRFAVIARDAPPQTSSNQQPVDEPDVITLERQEESSTDAPTVLAPTLAYLSQAALCAIAEAYGSNLSTGARRKKTPRAIVEQSGISEFGEWLAAYSLYHDQQVWAQNTAETLWTAASSTFDACKGQDKLSKRGGNHLMRKNLGLDKDGAQRLFVIWQSGKWPPEQNFSRPGNHPHMPGPAPAPDAPPAANTPPAESQTVPAQATAPGSSPRKGLTADDIARLLAPSVTELRQGKKREVAVRLARDVGVYPEKSWRLTIFDWRHGRGLFEQHGPEWDPLGRIAPPATTQPPPTLNTPYTISEAPRATAGTVTSPADAPATQRSATPSTSAFPQRRVSNMTNQELHELFKRYLPLVGKGMKMTDLTNLLVDAHQTYSARTWGNYIYDWRHKKGRFEGFVPVDTDDNALPLDRTPRKRSSVSASTPELSESARKRRQSTKSYAMEEEQRMAEYIVSRQPDDTRPTPRDWEDFAKQYRARSAAAYAEHWRSYRDRIEGMVQTLQAKGDGRRSSVSSSDSDGSSSVVEVTPPKRPVAPMVDLTAIDSDSD